MSRSARRPRLLVAAGSLAVIAVALGALWVTNRGSVPGIDAADSDVSSRAPDTGRSAPAAGVASQTPAPASAVPEAVPGQVIATDAAPSYGGGTTGVVITNAGWTAAEVVEVSGFMTDVVEDGGTCRVTLTFGGDTVRAEGAGMADATTTVCGGIEVGGPDLDPGLWQAVLSYESPTSSGVSAPVTVRVPTR
jgi:hypothetical protein